MSRFITFRLLFLCCDAFSLSLFLFLTFLLAHSLLHLPSLLYLLVVKRAFANTTNTTTTDKIDAAVFQTFVDGGSCTRNSMFTPLVGSIDHVCVFVGTNHKHTHTHTHKQLVECYRRAGRHRGVQRPLRL